MKYLERELYQTLLEHLKAEIYTIIVGARQIGKTTLLKRLYESVKKQGKISHLISFENAEILKQINLHPENIFRYIQKPENEIKKVFLFVDEIQYADNPSNFLKYLFDTYGEKLKIVATGSSAFYIDAKFNDSLAGRKRIFNLKHLNFSEFLTFKNAKELKSELDSIRKNKKYKSLYYNDLMSLFDEYLVYGAYPKVVLEKNVKEKISILKDLKNSYVKRDIYDSKVENESKFYQLMQILASQIGDLVNRNELAKTLRLDNKTIERYLHVLEKSFHVKLLPPFYSNIRKEIVKMPKIFFFDLGLRNVLLNNFQSLHQRLDKGELLENYAFVRLNELYDSDFIKFWRTTTGKEVDFVASEIYGSGKAYEVKFSANAINRKKYKQFIDSYKTYELNYVGYEYEDDELDDYIPILKL